MESQINLITAIIIVFFAAIVLYSLLQWRIEKKFLTGEEIVKVKAIIPWYVWLPAILFIPGSAMVFLEIFGFANNFRNFALFSMYLVLFLFVCGYQSTKISKINLPVEFVEKWRKLNFAFALAGILFMTASLIWNFVRWQNEGYRIFLSE